MYDNREVMASNIKFFMQENDLTATDICKALGIKQPTFSDWINGKSYPRIDKIEMLANYFHVSKRYLVEDWRLEQAGKDMILNLEIQSYADSFNTEQKKRLLEFAKFLNMQEGEKKHDDKRT